MKSIRYSAPGKVILSGEHAVVYGKPALVCAIDRRLAITFSECKETKYEDKLLPQLEKSVISFLGERGMQRLNKGYTYLIESDIPIGRGLGSSAAYCSALSAGLLELFTGREWSKEDINICAYQMEKYFHKNSSGVDTSTSIMGGLIYYRKEFEFLKTISSLPIKLPSKFMNSLVLIDTGKPTESTGEMVEKVGVAFNKSGAKMEALMNEIEKTTKRLIISIMKEDTGYFRENIQKNEALLEKIGVVSISTKQLLTQLKSLGTGKVTGAGGSKDASGYIFFYVEDMKNLLDILKKTGLTHIPFIPSYTGLTKDL